MANIFEKWNKNIDGEALVNDIHEVEEKGGTGEYKEVPAGTYDVRIDKLELRESKKGDPMVTCWFKILAGEYKNSLIFMNQVITQGFQFHIVNEFLRSLETDVKVEFDGDYSHYNDLIMDIAETIDGAYEFALNYGQTAKGFPTFKIEDVFEVE